jgi:hypothetical protein
VKVPDLPPACRQPGRLVASSRLTARAGYAPGLRAAVNIWR